MSERPQQPHEVTHKRQVLNQNLDTLMRSLSMSINAVVKYRACLVFILIALAPASEALWPKWWPMYYDQLTDWEYPTPVEDPRYIYRKIQQNMLY